MNAHSLPLIDLRLFLGLSLGLSGALVPAPARAESAKPVAAERADSAKADATGLRAVCTLNVSQHTMAKPIYSTTYLVDKSGKLAVEETSVRGTLRGRVKYRRDAQQRVVEKCVFEEPGQKPGGCSQRRYRGAATAAYESDDLGSDGKVAARYRYEYDSAHREIRCTIDRGADGTIDCVQVTHYDNKGRVVRVDTEDKAAPSTPAAKTVLLYSYDASGKLTERALNEAGGQTLRTDRFAEPCAFDLSEAR